MRIISPILRSTLKASALCSLFVGAAFTGSSFAQEATRPDQVYVLDRKGEMRTHSGSVTTDGVSQVIITVGKSPKKYTSSSVTRVVFGDVPESYRAGESYLVRDELENAVRSFRLTADDNEARGSVRAMSRLRAGHALMASAKFAEAATEYNRFATDFPDSRLFPTASKLGARALLIAGDASAAALQGEQLFGLLDDSGRNAYTAALCLEAGLDAARAHLQAGDTAAAATLYRAIQTKVSTLLADAEPEERAPLEVVSTRVILGEGWGLLASDSAGQAVAFFSGKLRGELAIDQKYNARLGLAEALLMQKKYREAQLEFAAVSALAPSSRDDVAQALVGLAHCAQNLPDTDSQERVKGWLESCISQYGDTPAAAAARTLKANL